MQLVAPALLTSALALLPSVLLASPVTFSRMAMPTASRPRAITAADFNRDGRLDLATAGVGASVGILLNDGATFRAVTTIPVGGGPFELAAADLNGDGAPDLAIANADLNTVTVLLGRGDGTFFPKRDVAAAGNPRGLAVADVTTDGRPDILVTLFQSNAWLLLQGDGAGGFPSRTSVATAARPQGIAVADMNHDGRLDAVVTHAGASLVSIVYDAGRSSRRRVDLPVPSAQNVLVLADFDRDGWSDALVASSDHSTAYLIAGGRAGLRVRRTVTSTGHSPRGVAAADVNRDGWPDAVLANRNSDHVTLVLGGAGGLSGGTITEFAGDGSRAVLAGDFDRDGRVDVATANEDESTVALLGNQTTFTRIGYVLAGRTRGGSDVGGSTGLALADFDHDGRMDAAVAGSPGPKALLGDGRDRALDGQYPTDITTADFNADGHADILTSEYWSNGLMLYAGDGTGNFPTITRVAVVPRPTEIAVADFNRDGRPDVLAESYDEATGQGRLHLLLGQADGTLSAGSVKALPSHVNGLDTADVDRDGRMDAVLALFNPSSVLVLYGDGSGGWRAEASSPLSSHAYDLCVADVDADGWQDVVVPMWESVGLLYGGTAGLEPVVHHGQSTNPPSYISDAGTGDVDLDGRIDIVTSDGDVLFGRGGRTFELARFAAYGDTPRVADFTGDGLPDFLLAQYGGLVVLANEASDVNRAPAVDAGDDITLNYAEQEEFDITANGTDPDAHELRYEWRNAGGHIVSREPWLLPGRLPAGTHEFTVTVFDERGGTASDTVTYTVTPYQEIYMHVASAAWPVSGRWAIEADTTAASGQRLRHPNANEAKLAAALTAPMHYFEVSFLADPTQTYKLWIRGKADGNAWANDSAFVQFSGATDVAGTPAWRIGTTSALDFNLEECSGCGVAGWGWEDDGWGAVNRHGVRLRFPEGGWQRLRIQTREDGLAIDQIVLSSERFLTTRPGTAKNDTAILPATSGPQP